jgi:hypothetical protein
MFLLILIMENFGPSQSLDIKFYYSGAEARALIQNLHAFELKYYFRNELIDLIFIFTYTSALWIGLRRIFPNNKATATLALLPGFFDLIETIAIIYAVKRPGGPHDFFDWLGVVTSLKWIFVAIAIGAVIMGLVRRKLIK